MRNLRAADFAEAFQQWWWFVIARGAGEKTYK
jgi:hypothetical protein